MDSVQNVKTACIQTLIFIKCQNKFALFLISKQAEFLDGCDALTITRKPPTKYDQQPKTLAVDSVVAAAADDFSCNSGLSQPNFFASLFFIMIVVVALKKQKIRPMKLLDDIKID